MNFTYKHALHNTASSLKMEERLIGNHHESLEIFVK
jgi:hypothetical protein